MPDTASDLAPELLAACWRSGRHLIEAQSAEEAEIAARQDLIQHPNCNELRLNLALALLMQGRYRDGFREYQGRPLRQTILARQLPYPELDGPISGRSILVWGEQGLGDEIMFSRFIPQLRQLGAARITLACSPPLVRAFQQLGADLVLPRFGEVVVPKHDCWVPLLSLPYALGIDFTEISGRPYLRAQPRKRGGIGLVERGRSTNPRDADRSIPDGLLKRAVPNGKILNAQGDVYDSLRHIAGLDLLITVDTSWAHMAGALGVPCWILLPYRNLDWRWMRERTDTVWYDSARLFRQPEAGGWNSVLEEVQAALSRI